MRISKALQIAKKLRTENVRYKTYPTYVSDIDKLHTGLCSHELVEAIAKLEEQVRWQEANKRARRELEKRTRSTGTRYL